MLGLRRIVELYESYSQIAAVASSVDPTVPKFFGSSPYKQNGILFEFMPKGLPEGAEFLPAFIIHFGIFGYGRMAKGSLWDRKQALVSGKI